MIDYKEKISVLFVCMGNICRSPTAEGVFRHLVEEGGLSDHIEIDSAGPQVAQFSLSLCLKCIFLTVGISIVFALKAGLQHEVVLMGIFDRNLVRGDHVLFRGGDFYSAGQ